MKPPDTQADLFLQLLRAGYALARTHGMERAFMVDPENVAQMRRWWAHPGVRAAYELAKSLGAK